MKATRRRIIGISATTLLSVALLIPASAAKPSMYSYDGTNPASTPCASDAVTLPGYPKTIYSPDGTTSVGTYEIRYSPSHNRIPRIADVRMRVDQLRP
jgi:hypothetical protein